MDGSVDLYRSWFSMTWICNKIGSEQLHRSWFSIPKYFKIGNGSYSIISFNLLCKIHNPAISIPLLDI